jgi:DNA-directed RNA polymerase subunit RPC12/RpoP
MKVIAELMIPKMFSAYANDIGYLKNNGLHHKQYYCNECDQPFSAAWGMVQGSMNYSERGSYFHCPHCGTRYSKNAALLKLKEDAPDQMRLVIREYRHAVTFEISCRTMQFSDYLAVDFYKKYRECFRFDVKDQTATFTRHSHGIEDVNIQIGNPYNIDVLGKVPFNSILAYFQPFSIPNTKEKTKLNEIVKILRDTVHRKLEKRLGYKVSSMFVSSGQYHGTFLLPILNIAYRLACPDAPNLPAIYRESPKAIQNFWASNLIEDFGYMNRVMAATRKGKSFISALIETAQLPDKPFVRHSLLEDPFLISLFIKSFSLCENYDHATQILEGSVALAHGAEQMYIDNYWKSLWPFLGTMKQYYGEPGIARLVVDYKELRTRDCINLYNQLNPENKQALVDEKVKLRDLHDWMSLRHKKQTHVNLKFNVPDHIIKRLSMQTDHLKFFMPKESLELLEAGHSLNNCVASYGQAMKDNSKWIVLVADDKGKLAVCLEIKGNEVIQAKTNRNNPVSNDVKLNSEVIAWAKEANLKIKTADIRVPDKNKLAKTG